MGFSVGTGFIAYQLNVRVGSNQGALLAPHFARILAGLGHSVNVILDSKARLFVGPASFLPVCRVYESEIEATSPSPDILDIYFAADSGTIAALARGMKPRESPGRTQVFPALDEDTVAHPSVRKNLDLLTEDGVGVLEGVGGSVAGADEAVAFVLGKIGRESGVMRGLRLLVSAGGTHENIDSVRFIGNRSSGKMGLAIAREAHRMGAEVTVVAANIAQREPGVGWVPVESVEDMEREISARIEKTDAIVMAAAVSDFTPASRLEGKIRRGESQRITLDLEATQDILGGLRDGRRNPRLFVVGFAATHGEPVPDAREKLVRKGADIIVGNDISQAGIGFSSDENEVHIVGRDVERFIPRDSKSAVARTLLGIMSEEMAKMGDGRNYQHGREDHR